MFRSNGIRGLIFFLAISPAYGETLTGVVTHVRDGDTIVVNETPVRLSGVSAPERNEPGGLEATEFMARYLGKVLRCELFGRSYDRMVGICSLDGEDIGASVIRAGYALDCPRYSKGRYSKLDSPALRAVYKLPRYCHGR